MSIVQEVGAEFKFLEVTLELDWAPPCPFPPVCFGWKKEAEEIHLWLTGRLVGFYFYSF